MEYPKLRNVEIIPFNQGGQSFVMLRDPEQISEQTVILPQSVLYILRFFDGRHSSLDIRSAYMRRFGTFLYEQDLEQLITHLNAGFLLDNDRFRQHRQTVHETFLRTPIRKARFAGSSYLAEPERLKEQLDSFFLAVDGPGLPSATARDPLPKAIIAPHIDIEAGGPCYSHAYKILAEAKPADLYIIFGISHHLLPNLFAATVKSFETPLGLAATDADFVTRLNHECGGFLFADELWHRTEHTIEFQIVFLQHTLKRPFKIAPILCSFDYSILDHTDQEIERQKFSGFVQSLRRLIRNYPGHVCIIASVDLAHIGPRYGDDSAPDLAMLGQLGEFEDQIFRTIVSLDGDTFLQLTASVQNKFKICGFPAIYTLLKCLDSGTGKLLSYARTPADANGSLVSYASMVIY